MPKPRSPRTIARLLTKLYRVIFWAALLSTMPLATAGPSSAVHQHEHGTGYTILRGAGGGVLAQLLSYTGKQILSEMHKISNQPHGKRRHRLLHPSSIAHKVLVDAATGWLNAVGIREHAAVPFGPSVIATEPGAVPQNCHSDMEIGWSIILAINDRALHFLTETVLLSAGDVLIFDATLPHWGAANLTLAVAWAAHLFAALNLTKEYIKKASRPCAPAPPPQPPSSELGGAMEPRPQDGCSKCRWKGCAAAQRSHHRIRTGRDHGSAAARNPVSL